MRKILIVLMLLIVSSLQAQWFPITNPKVPLTSNKNTFSATQYFNKLVCDTMIINHIDSVHSTYWFSNTGDIIGYIDAGTEKVAFFKQMTIGNLTTNTTVAENFIRSNQVQTDTLIPHSPLILAGDTTIAKKIFADSVMTGKVKAGNILINGVDNSINGANIIYANTFNANGSGYFGNVVINGSNKTISGVDTVIIGNKRKIYVASNGWVTIDSGLYTPYLFSHSLEGGANALNTSNDSVFILAGNGVSSNSIYNQNLLISGVRGEYLSMSNIRYIRLGWTSDSVAVLEPYNSGQWTKRLFVITADTVKSMALKSSSDMVIVAGINKKIFFSDMYGGALRMSIGVDGLQTYANNAYDIGSVTNKFKNLYLGTCLYSPTAIFNPTAEPSTPTAGQIYFNSTDNKFYGYNGTAWKQLDN